jgi:ABC-type nitrate/sulfonate/bicarbonate transport system substrate-binding protein
LMMKVGIRPEGMAGTTVRIILLLVLTVFQTSCNQPVKSAGPREKATIGVASAILSVPIFIAAEKGFFSDEELDVTLKPYTSDKKAMDDMVSGAVDLATVSGTSIVLNSFIREDFLVFATFSHSYDDIKVIGRTDKGIRSPADLKGRKIGTAFATSAHFFSHIYLSEHGMVPSDVTLTDISPDDLTGALQQGRVDAVVIFEPYAYRVQKALPDKTVMLPKSQLYRETFNLAAMKRFADAHPGLLRKILRGLERAVTFIRQNREESMALMIRKNNMDENFIVSVWDDFMYQLSLDQSLLTSLEDEARWVIKNRMTPQTRVPNYLPYVDPDGMKAVKPEAATIIKEAIKP